MLKSEMQHQFWITKKTVQRKLGSKEDKHIISSDAELDAKIEVFKSISETSADLDKIIDQYQERLCILSQEECVFGRFLKEVGRRSKTTGTIIANTAKAVSYSGQQRMCVRVPLLRLHHEVEVFRFRAVRDTYVTIQNMEKERTEYRAALSWMKSTSTELDPDTGRGLDKFRTAQSHVRLAKQSFDTRSLDSVQKIELLAAARCNMYSHALLSYMNELKQFAQKTANTFETISKSLLQKPKYDFCVLKDLTQDEHNSENNDAEANKGIPTVDKDQSLFFADDFIDERAKTMEKDQELHHASATAGVNVNSDKILAELNQEVAGIITSLDETQNALENKNANKTNNFWFNMFASSQQSHYNITSSGLHETNAGCSDVLLEAINTTANTKKDEITQEGMKTTTGTTKSTQWMDLFMDLDPLANPEAFDLKLNGGRTNFQQT